MAIDFNEIMASMRQLFFARGDHQLESKGAASGGRPVLLDRDGRLDSSLFVSSGDWTPADASGAGLSLTTARGWYDRIGNRLLGEAQVTYPATADTSGATLDGLPFTIAEHPDVQTIQGGWVFFSTYGAPIAVWFNADVQKFAFSSGQSSAGYTNANMSGKQVRFGFSLRISE